MVHSSRCAGLVLCALALINAINTGPDICASEPVRLIFDTDMGNDIDDALALGMIHSLQSRGECELLAVTSSKDNPYSAAFIDLVNNFYGRPEIPVGAVRNGSTPESGKFVQAVCELEDAGKRRFARSLESGDDAPEAVKLLRRVLASQPDESVVVAVVGFSTNLAKLLDSEADENSELGGTALVKKKCRLLSMMAGMFGHEPRRREYNVFVDAAAAKRVLADWPSPIVLSGYEIGRAILYPAVSIERDFRYVPHHPLSNAYALYGKMPYDRPTWDLTSILYAVRPDRGYFDLSQSGRVHLDNDDVTHFSEDTEADRRYLIVSPAQTQRVREALVQLSSQPPENR